MVLSIRRADIVREKIVHNLVLKSLNPTTIQVDLETSAGLYVKEFMHGDEGRTVPFIGGLLGVDVAVKSLDVLGVDLEWPAKRSDYEECARIVDKAFEIDLELNK
jgi:tRNA pseudouridine synthase 10